jgi:hypothetical protein
MVQQSRRLRVNAEISDRTARRVDRLAAASVRVFISIQVADVQRLHA